MFDRVRAYTIVTVIMELMFAYACILGKGSFSMDNYTIIGDILPMNVWGGLFITGAVGLLYGMWRTSTTVYMVSLSICAGIMVTWGIALVYNMIQGNTTGPIGPVLLFIVAADKIIIASTPLFGTTEGDANKKKHPIK